MPQRKRATKRKATRKRRRAKKGPPAGGGRPGKHDWAALKADFLASEHRSVAPWGREKGFDVRKDSNFQHHTRGWAKAKRALAEDVVAKAAAKAADKAAGKLAGSLANRLVRTTELAAELLEVELTKALKEARDENATAGISQGRAFKLNALSQVVERGRNKIAPRPPQERDDDARDTARRIREALGEMDGLMGPEASG